MGFDNWLRSGSGLKLQKDTWPTISVSSNLWIPTQSQLGRLVQHFKCTSPTYLDKGEDDLVHDWSGYQPIVLGVQDLTSYWRELVGFLEEELALDFKRVELPMTDLRAWDSRQWRTNGGADRDRCPQAQNS